MISAISEDVRLHLVGSIAVVERHRAEITTRLQSQLAGIEPDWEASGQTEITAATLVDLIMESASNLAACGAPGDLRHVADEHRRLKIDGRHYSRFGLALPAILREVLGPTMPPRIASAWCDAFWFTIRNVAPRDEPELQVRLRRAPGRV
jgi:hemoglobin-like flavoprotein